MNEEVIVPPERVTLDSVRLLRAMVNVFTVKVSVRDFERSCDKEIDGGRELVTESSSVSVFDPCTESERQELVRDNVRLSVNV